MIAVSRTKVSGILVDLLIVAVSLFMSMLLVKFADGKEYLGSGKSTLNVAFFRAVLLYFIPFIFVLDILDRAASIIIGKRVCIYPDKVIVYMYGLRHEIEAKNIASLLLQQDRIFGGYFVGVRLKQDAVTPGMAILTGFRGILGAGGQEINLQQIKYAKTRFPISMP